MRLLQFLTTVNLFEAAKDRYEQMFTNILPMYKNFELEAVYENTVISEIDWAMRVLKKQDKIIWYLRMVKVAMLEEFEGIIKEKLQDLLRVSHTEEEKAEAMQGEWAVAYKTAMQAYQKARDQLAKKMGISGEDARRSASGATETHGFKNRMRHFMSLELPAIDDYVFSNQTPRQIIQDWTPIEDAWKAKRVATIPIDREGVDTLIEYPDGSEWVNLNTAYCQAEGDAMGHCGNGGSQSDDDTVLSYRTIEEVDGEKLWKPRLTFILNRKNGLLGETKGRANQPPAEKYHNVIVDLLKHDFIKGIRGGGYMPENNFKLGDLPEETQDELIELKPGLASLEYDYKKRGMTKQLLNRMEAMWEETELDFPEFKDDTFLYDTSYGLDQFLSEYGGDQAEWIAKILDGREHLDIDLGGQSYYKEEIFDGLSTEDQLAVGAWLIEKHGDKVEEWKEENDTDYDGTDASDTLKIANEYDIDEINDALYRAEMTGHEYGAESEMSNDLSSWLKELPNEMDWDLSVYPDTTYEEEDEGYRKIGVPVETFIDILDNHLNDVAYQGGITELAGIKKLESPYHGWQGFDEEGAKERAGEELHETGVLQ
jgi:hypothetical protein